MCTGQPNSSLDDLTQVYSVPVFMIQSAMESMASAKDVGEKEEEREQLQLLFEILGAIFAIIPFLDAATPALELADGFFLMVSVLGQEVLTGVEISQNPDQTASLIFDFLLDVAGGRGVRGPKDDDDVAALAAGRRVSSDDQRKGISQHSKDHDDEFQGSVRYKCMP